MLLSDKQAAFSDALVRFLAANRAIEVDGAIYRYRLDYLHRSAEENARLHAHPKSTHIYRLAADILLDKSLDGGVTWEWVDSRDDPAWSIMHQRWEDYGGSPMIQDDPGHFSFEHNGVR